MKIALVHDSITQSGGAERVVDCLHEVFPEAPVYTLVMDRKLAARYATWDIRTTWLQPLYNFLPKLQYWLFFIPWAVGSIRIKDVEVVISSSSGFAKNIRVAKNVCHVNYCHTPSRFLWIDKDYINQEVKWFFRPGVKLFLWWMKKWDSKGSKTVNIFIANSKEVQKRIAEVYSRDSEVIYPAIDTDFWKPTQAKQNYFLVAGRLQAHKRIDFIVECFNELNLPLHVVGTGRQESYLKSISGPNIKFLGYVSDDKLRDEYSGAIAFIYPQVEDFGLMPLEAAACGTPTLAFARGGALETVISGVTGEFFESYNKLKVKEIVLDWQQTKYKQEELWNQALKFNKDAFKNKIHNLIDSLHLARPRKM